MSPPVPPMVADPNAPGPGGKFAGPVLRDVGCTGGKSAKLPPSETVGRFA